MNRCSKELNAEEIGTLKEKALKSTAEAELKAFVQFITYCVLVYMSDFYDAHPVITKLFFIILLFLNSTDTVLSYYIFKKNGKISPFFKYSLYSLIILTILSWSLIYISFYFHYGFSIETIIVFFAVLILSSANLTEYDNNLPLKIFSIIFFVPLPWLITGIIHTQNTQNMKASHILIIGSIIYIVTFVFIAIRNHKNYWENNITAVIIQKQTEESKLMHLKLAHSYKLASLGQLSAGVSHEINNPLTIIKGNLEIIQIYLTETNCKDENVKQSFNIIYTAMNRIVSIIKSLKDLSSEHNTKVLNIINLQDTINKSMDLFEKTFEELYNIKIIKKFKASKCDIVGDVTKVMYIFTSLLNNAKEALSNTIELSTYNDNKNIIVEIKDNGQGIKKEHLGNIFTIFFTTKDLGKGIGLSLATIYSYLEAMNAKISVSSEIDQGCTFKIVFPLSEY